MLGITLLLFVIAQLIPGDPAVSALGISASNEAKARFRAENHLNDAVWSRYVHYMDSLLHGNLGESVTSRQSVGSLILHAMPVTLQLSALAAILAAAVAIVFGTWSAARPGGGVDVVVRVVSMGGLSMPPFWVGLLLIEFAAVRWNWFPPSGFTPLASGVGPWFDSLFLPATALAIPMAASLVRVVRSSMREELQKDYVRTARGIGLSPVLVLKNTLRNALLTPLTVFGVKVASLLSGAVLIETIFSLPGLGQLLIEAVSQGDLPLIQGVVLVATMMFVFVNLLVDIAYLVLNPRIRVA
jgi:peptide/nickel transport system permease protein